MYAFTQLGNYVFALTDLYKTTLVYQSLNLIIEF